MKYYICSPIGRTGSKRIVFGLHKSLKLTERMFISLEGMYDENNPLFQGFKLYTFPDVSNMYTDEQAIRVMNEWEKPITLHSHNVNLLPTDPSGWKFILSTRKRKIDTVLSGLIARKTGSSGPHQAIDKDFEPFHADVDAVDRWMEEYVKRENAFCNNIKILTGKPARKIYLEDNWKTIQQKVGQQFTPEAEHQDTHTISTHKAKDYITNYEEIQDRYDQRLQEYKLRFPTETN
jgi:hypothetical protein